MQLRQGRQIFLTQGQVAAKPANIVSDDSAEGGGRSFHLSMLENDDFASTDNK
jgi:hypothetical protein